MEVSVLQRLTIDTSIETTRTRHLVKAIGQFASKLRNNFLGLTHYFGVHEEGLKLFRSLVDLELFIFREMILLVPNLSG